MDPEPVDNKKVDTEGAKPSMDIGPPSTKTDEKGRPELPFPSTAPAASTADQNEKADSSVDLVRESPTLASAVPAASAGQRVAEPDVHVSPATVEDTSFKSTLVSVRDVLGRFGKRVVEVTRQAEDLAGNVWQHLKTGPSIADATMGRIAQGTKVIAEGGYENIFKQTFDTLPGEELRRCYACYLSTSAGPVIGILYISSAKLAYCSDNPLSYKVGDKTEWSYYKVVIPLQQLKQVSPSASRAKRADKYIQVMSVDNHEFWFMGFVNYESAVKYLQEVLQGSS